MVLFIRYWIKCTKWKKNHKGDSMKRTFNKIRVLNERVTATLWTGNKQVHVGFAKLGVSEVFKLAFYLML